MTGSATHASAAGRTTQDEVGVERQVAKIDQVGFGASEGFRPEQFARLVERFLIQLSSSKASSRLIPNWRVCPSAYW
jgi:hypothetical protein